MKKKNKLAKKDSKQFAWFLIYENYDDVLAKYSDWILKQEKRVDQVLDIRSPIVEYLDKKRSTDAGFTMSGDGVHFNGTCHRIIARTIIEKVLGEKKAVEFNENVVALTRKRMNLKRDAWLSEIGHKRPGVKAGLKMNELKLKVAEIDEQIRVAVENSK